MSSYEFWFTMRSITFAAFVIGAPDMSSGFLGAGLGSSCAFLSPSFTLLFFCISFCSAIRS